MGGMGASVAATELLAPGLAKTGRRLVLGINELLNQVNRELVPGMLRYQKLKV